VRSGGLLWLTNVIVFALWYWRLDRRWTDIAPQAKQIRQAQAFFFHRCRSRMTNVPNLSVRGWRPPSSITFRRFHAEFYIRPTMHPCSHAGKGPRNDPDFYFTQHRRFADLACSRRSLTVPPPGRYFANRIKFRLRAPKYPPRLAGWQLNGAW